VKRRSQAHERYDGRQLVQDQEGDDVADGRGAQAVSVGAQGARDAVEDASGAGAGSGVGAGGLEASWWGAGACEGR
jgi:hypothetical protein